MMRSTQVMRFWDSVFFVLLSLWAPLAFAQNDLAPDQQHYLDCMKLANGYPKEGLKGAEAWVKVGGGYPAHHCQATAFMQLGQYEKAARAFEDIALEVNADPELKAKLFIQSANAWLIANNFEHARQLADTVLTLQPQNSDAFLVRAQAFGLLGKFWEAADDLTRVLYADPNNLDVLTLRGSAYRRMSAFDLALTDLNQVLGQDPQNAQALLERGLVHRDNANPTTARSDWQAVIRSHPDTDEAKAAEAYVQKLNEQ